MAAHPRNFHAAGLASISSLMFAATEPEDITLPYRQPKPPMPNGPLLWNRNIDFPSIATIYSQPPFGVRSA